GRVPPAADPRAGVAWRAGPRGASPAVPREPQLVVAVGGGGTTPVRGQARREGRRREARPTTSPCRVPATFSQAASRNRTDTTFDTPACSMVIPYSVSAASIVRRLCVMSTNCDDVAISRTTWLKRP